MLEVYKSCDPPSFYVMNRTQEIERQLEELETELGRLSGRANLGEDYWFVMYCVTKGFYAYPCEESSNASADSRFESGNYYLTKEAAQKRADRINLDFKIEKWQRESDPDFVPDWNDCAQRKFFFYISSESWELVVGSCDQNPGIDYYFSSREIIEKFISELGDEVKKVMFGVGV